ncbi:MAG: DUF479 domain-containing protein [Saprospiraceae bacterium]|nr:DUF479 domain-containing protein [Saprospiraceae bacterium]
MNFLAHSYLSFDIPDLVVGNYLGDFVKNKHLKTLPQGIQQGVKLHRFIDSYTDVHPLVKTGTRMLHASMAKYAPVAIDIYFDFLLAKHWALFHESELPTFCEKIYDTLMAYDGPMPDYMIGRRRRMVAGRWLENYRTYAGLQKVFTFLSKRAKFPSNLDQAGNILLTLEKPLEVEVFLPFFPILIDAVNTEISTYPSK